MAPDMPGPIICKSRALTQKCQILFICSYINVAKLKSFSAFNHSLMKYWKTLSLVQFADILLSKYVMLHNVIFMHRHTTNILLLTLTLVLPEIADITGITAFTTLIHYRLKPFNNSGSAPHTHRQRCTLPWAPVCGLSGAADGWLIDWGGPLMISVANDLLNNSLGLCRRTDGRPNANMGMFTGRLSAHSSSPAFISCLTCTH